LKLYARSYEDVQHSLAQVNRIANTVKELQR
jgi:hypothetical protein